MEKDLTLITQRQLIETAIRHWRLWGIQRPRRWFSKYGGLSLTGVGGGLSHDYKSTLAEAELLISERRTCNGSNEHTWPGSLIF